MTKIDLRLQYQKETGVDLIFTEQYRKIWVNTHTQDAILDYIEWLEGQALKLIHDTPNANPVKP